MNRAGRVFEEAGLSLEPRLFVVVSRQTCSKAAPLSVAPARPAGAEKSRPGEQLQERCVWS